jgi:hypothetical protein
MGSPSRRLACQGWYHWLAAVMIAIKAIIRIARNTVRPVKAIPLWSDLNRLMSVTIASMGFFMVSLEAPSSSKGFN